jgi:hypothetical protein
MSLPKPLSFIPSDLLSRRLLAALLETRLAAMPLRCVISIGAPDRVRESHR